MEKYAFVQMSVYKPRVEKGSQIHIIHYKVLFSLPNLAWGEKKNALTWSTFNLKSVTESFSPINHVFTCQM